MSILPALRPVSVSRGVSALRATARHRLCSALRAAALAWLSVLMLWLAGSDARAASFESSVTGLASEDRDQLGATWIQFIPVVERATDETLAMANRGWSDRPGQPRLLYTQTGTRVTDRSAGPEQYGRFLIDVFEEWVRHDIARVYVQLFDVTLEASFGRHRLCVLAEGPAELGDDLILGICIEIGHRPEIHREPQRRHLARHLAINLLGPGR